MSPGGFNGKPYRRPVVVSPRDLRKGSTAAEVTRAVAGARAKRHGALFEDEIDSTCITYRQRGLGVFTRNFPPVAGPPQRMFFTGPGPVDFTGHWCGVPVAFDCKTTQSDPMSWRFPPNKMHQAAFLHDFQSAAKAHSRLAFAFVLLKTSRHTYIISDVSTLSRGEEVVLRERAVRGAESLVVHVPVVKYTPLGLVPWDFLATLHFLPKAAP